MLLLLGALLLAMSAPLPTESGPRRLMASEPEWGSTSNTSLPSASRIREAR
jgi:hypothetical protein